MPVFEIPAQTVISTITRVEADTLEEAIDEQYLRGWEGVMFLDHRYPDVGDWEIDEAWAREINEVTE